MRQAFDNDNEELSFLTLQAATRNVVRYLVNEHQKPDCERDTPRKRTEEEKTKDERNYITTRLREIAAWERRITNLKKIPRR